MTWLLLVLSAVAVVVLTVEYILWRLREPKP